MCYSFCFHNCNFCIKTVHSLMNKFRKVSSKYIPRIKTTFWMKYAWLLQGRTTRIKFSTLYDHSKVAKFCVQNRLFQTPEWNLWIEFLSKTFVLQHSCFRKFMLAVYMLVILLLVAALIIITVFAPIEDNWVKFQSMIAPNNTDGQ